MKVQFYCEVLEKNCYWFKKQPCQNICEKACRYIRNKKIHVFGFKYQEFVDAFFHEQSIKYKELLKCCDNNKKLTGEVIKFLYKYYNNKSVNKEDLKNVLGKFDSSDRYHKAVLKRFNWLFTDYDMKKFYNMI